MFCTSLLLYNQYSVVLYNRGRQQYSLVPNQNYWNCELVIRIPRTWPEWISFFTPADRWGPWVGGRPVYRDAKLLDRRHHPPVPPIQELEHGASDKGSQRNCQVEASVQTRPNLLGIYLHLDITSKLYSIYVILFIGYNKLRAWLCLEWMLGWPCWQGERSSKSLSTRLSRQEWKKRASYQDIEEG
jgi:hypothetical protein